MEPAHPAAAVGDLAALCDRLAACRACTQAGEPVQPPPITELRPGQRALLLGQAPGIHEPRLGRPFAASAGRRLRAWFAPLRLDDEDRFRAAIALSSVLKCYPGRDPGGRGDRRPTRTQLARCAPWTEAIIRVLDPPLLIPVGGLAIERLLGRGPLAEVVGRRFELDGRAVVPLPHPSGASAWLNDAANRVLVERAIGLIGAELGRLGALPA